MRARSITFAVALLSVTAFGKSLDASTRSAASFKLDNGLQVVVVPYPHSGLVTHSVWYRTGGADDPIGQAGLAHFVEHLMFRDSETHEGGSFSDVVAHLGGNDDGVTELDFTYYYQTIARKHLHRVMKLEAQRMTRLVVEQAAVDAERGVVLEELASDPIDMVLEDRMREALYPPHPYRRPVIGWPKEVASLSRSQAVAFHGRYYTPDNAIIVIVGDITVDEAKALAARTYGRARRRAQFKPITRRSRSPTCGARRLEMRSPRLGKPLFRRLYLGPNRRTAPLRTIAALELLVDLLAGGKTSRLHQALVVHEGKATKTNVTFISARRDYVEVSISADVADGYTLNDVEAAVNKAIERLIDEGVARNELDRSKRRRLAELIFQSDSQQMIGAWYGRSLATGMTMTDINEWPDRIQRITVDAVHDAAQKYLSLHCSVTAFFLPHEAGSPHGDDAFGDAAP